MGPAPFEEAYVLLRSTMPGAEIYDCTIHDQPDALGFQTGRRAATIVCFEPRLTTSVRQILGWTFLVDNRFLAGAVQKIVMVWIEHEGGLRHGEPALTRALRHCFKRFYAESLVALGPSPMGRTMLIESIVFERQLLAECRRLAHAGEDDAAAAAFRSRAHQFVNMALHIATYHEMGHIVVKRFGETLEQLSERHLAGLAPMQIRALLKRGEHRLAEEVYCDIFALDSLVSTEEDLSALMQTQDKFCGSLHLDEMKGALFCYTVMMNLTQIWLDANQESRRGLNPMDGAHALDTDQPESLSRQSSERLWNVSSMVQSYISGKGGRLYARDGRFYLNDRFENLLAAARGGLDAVVEDRDDAVVSRAEREIARFLALPMQWSAETGAYLVNESRNREWHDWRLGATEASPAGSTNSAGTDGGGVVSNPTETDGRDADRGPLYTAGSVSKTIKAAYARYCVVFDNILSEMVCDRHLDIEIESQLEALLSELLGEMNVFRVDDSYTDSGPLKKFGRAMSEHFQQKMRDHHATTLTLLAQQRMPDCPIDHPLSTQDRLTLLEEYCARNPERGVAAYAALLLPELRATHLIPVRSIP